MVSGLYTMITVVLIIIWGQRGGNYSPGFVTNIGGFYNYWVSTPIYGCAVCSMTCLLKLVGEVRSAVHVDDLCCPGSLVRLLMMLCL